MKLKNIFFPISILLLVAACSTQPTTSEAESTATPAATSMPETPAPVTETAKTDVEACVGKAAKDSCSYTADEGEVNGTCVRSETHRLHCLPKKSKKK